MEDLREKVESRLRNHDLEGTEITEEDLEIILNLSEEMELEDAIDRVLNGIRKCLDDGMEE